MIQSMTQPKPVAVALGHACFAFLLAGLLAVAAVSPSLAQETAGPREQIRLPLTVEGWVATETAEVVLAAELTLVDQDPAQVREDVIKTFKRIDDSDWRIVSFGRNTDAAGAERWSILASARVPQARLDGLHDRVRRAGGSGKSFRVASVDTSPSLAEREAVLRGLRSRIYAMARNELAVAKVLWPDRDVRIAQVQFTDTGAPRPVPYRARGEMMAQASSDSKDAATTTEEKIVLRAWVTLVPAP